MAVFINQMVNAAHAMQGKAWTRIRPRSRRLPAATRRRGAVPGVCASRAMTPTRSSISSAGRRHAKVDRRLENFEAFKTLIETSDNPGEALSRFGS
jgi:hypothetical protein